MENLVPIGQFAESALLSQKALRLYAANGLLPPAWVDPGSGYRYYRVEQLRTARLIGLLRAAGMPLAEIRSFLAQPDPARLDAHEARLAGELAERRRVLRYVRRLLEETPMYEVRIKQVEPQRYDSVTRRLRVDELDGFIASTVAELGGAGDAPPFAVYHGRVNEQEDGPVEMCVPRAGGARELPAGEVAYTVAEGKQCEFPEILGAYDAVARWVQEQGRELAGPPREIYLDGPNSPTRMEIDWPLVRLDSRAEEH